MKKIVLNVEGMVCNGCENRVKNALKTLDGVNDVEADHTTGIVTITSNDELSISTIEEKIEDIGFTIVKEK